MEINKDYFPINIGKCIANVDEYKSEESLDKEYLLYNNFILFNNKLPCLSGNAFEAKIARWCYSYYDIDKICNCADSKNKLQLLLNK